MPNLTRNAWLDPAARLATSLQGVWQTADTANALRYGVAFVSSFRQVVRERNLRAVDARMAGRPVTFDVGGTSITLAGTDFSAAREMYCRRVYLSHPELRLEPGTQVIDLGANIGLFTLLAAKRGARVLAVEAQAGFVRELQTRIAAQGCKDLVKAEVALVGPGTGYFSSAETLARGSHYEPGQDTPTLSMPALLARHGIQRVDFMKIDIEGSEFALFAEPQDWLDCVQQIALEVHPQFGSPHTLETQLQAAGFRTSLHDDLLRSSNNVSNAGGYLFAWRPR